MLLWMRENDKGEMDGVRAGTGGETRGVQGICEVEGDEEGEEECEEGCEERCI